MTPVMKSVSKVIFLTILGFQSAKVSTLGIPGISWDWGGASKNYSKVTTPPEIIQRFKLLYPFGQCSSGMEGVMTRLVVYPCVAEKGRCLLTRGENVTLDLEFISNIPSDGLVGSLSSVFSRWFSPLPLGESQDLCQSEFIQCPIQPYIPYRFRTSILVRPDLPELSPDIQVVIQTNTGRDIACAIVPVSIPGSEREVRDSLLRMQLWAAARNATLPVAQ